MQYYGLATTEIPGDVIPEGRGYGIGQSASDELIGQRPSMVEQTQPFRHSLPVAGLGNVGQTGLTSSHGGGFAAVYPVQQVLNVCRFVSLESS